MPKAKTVDRVTEQMTKLFSQVIREGGRLGDPPDRALTSTQGLALGILVTQGAKRLWALAEDMKTTDATATRTVDALEAVGLVRRTTEPTDRRGIIVSATARGRALYKTRMGRMRNVVESLLKNTDEAERVRIASFLEELNAALSGDESGAKKTGRR